MRTTRAFIASFGTSAVLVASSVATLAIVSAVLAFNSFPSAHLVPPDRTLVVRPVDGVEPIELTAADVEAASEAEGSEPGAADPADGGEVPSPSGAAPAGTGAGDTSSPTAGLPPADAPPADTVPPADNLGGGDGPLDRIPGVREVRGLEPGDTGRRATRTLADDVVGRASPEAGDALKRAAEPVWKLLD